MRFLLFVDGITSGKMLHSKLTDAGHVVDVASNVAQFQEITALAAHDLYVIDQDLSMQELPQGDGLELIKELRRMKGRSAPILIVSTRNQITDKVLGLDSGADEYMSKPVHIDELLARIRALLRRPVQLQARRLKVGSLSLNCASGDITFNGRLVELRASERQLLALLIRSSGRVVPKSLIADSLRPMDQAITPNSIEKLVSRLRKSLHRAAMGVELQTIRGGGYVLKEFNEKSATMQ